MTGFQKEVRSAPRTQAEIDAERANQSPELTTRDQDNIDAFLSGLLDDFSAGTVTKFQAVQGLAHIITALSKGNYPEARNWFEQGRKLIRSLDQ